MVSKLLLCIFWAEAISASSSFDSLGQSFVAAISTQSTAARSGIRTIDLRKRTDNGTQKCDPSKMTWYETVEAYSKLNRQSLNESLIEVLGESNMTLTGNLTLASSPYDPNRVFCDIFPKHYDNSGTSFPKCVLETAIDDFCTVLEDTLIDTNIPFSTNSKGGLWKTYKFYGYSISGLYVAVEISKTPECAGHRRTLFPNKGPDQFCKDKLLRQIVDGCQTGSTYIKFGGVATDSCETWAIYPLPPFQNAIGGYTTALGDTASGSTGYPLCGTSALYGVFPTTGSWSTPTAYSQATLTAPTMETNFDSADTTGTKFKRADHSTHPVARETSVAASSIPAGPGRRQLVGV